MQNAVNAPKIGGIIRLTRFILFTTLLAEGMGTLFLVPVFSRTYGLKNGIVKALFHSVSAFCNAGFDILGDKTAYSSLTGYRADILLNAVIMLLIVAGGLGFLTWEDLIRSRFRIRKICLQTKLVLITSAILILLPAVFFFFMEFGQTQMPERICLSLFQSVTTRTAGFNTADFSAMSDGAKLIMIFLMMIGGSPGSTAGGMKTTTFAVILLAAVSFIRQKRSINACGRSVPPHVVMEAFTLLVLYLGLLLFGSCMICMTERVPLMDSMFEAASALGTVGLTTGITPTLGTSSRLLLIFFMFFGRTGGLTLAYVALSTGRTDPGKLPAENVMVG